MSQLDAALIAVDTFLENNASPGGELEKAISTVGRIRTTISQHGEVALTDADYSALRKLVTSAKNLKIKNPAITLLEAALPPEEQARFL